MKSVYPQGEKSSWQAQAEAICAGNIATSEADIPMLLEWLQDMNWPGAAAAAGFLKKFGPSLIDPIREVLRSGDKVWINWVLISFKDEFDCAFWLPLRDELDRISGEFDEEGAHIAAMTIMAKHNFAPSNALRVRICQARNALRLETEGYDELERTLSEE